MMGYKAYFKALNKGISFSQGFISFQYPLTRGQGVGGSNPLIPTIEFYGLRFRP